MQLLALGWCTSLISDSGLAIVNKNMHAEIIVIIVIILLSTPLRAFQG